MKRWVCRLLYAVVVFCVLFECAALTARAEEGGIPVGGIHILKTDLIGNTLEGAVFQIARFPQDGELLDQAKEKKVLKIDGEHRIMVLESFWSCPDMTGEKRLEAQTDEAGRAGLYGLPYGAYYLIETRAPEGYNRIIDPIRVTVHKYSHLTNADDVYDDQSQIIDNTLHIINVRYTIPDTGFSGTLQLAAAGTGVLFSAAALILLNQKRWR